MKKNLSSNFELQGVCEFREASRELLLLTGTPSVHNLKFLMRTYRVLELPVTAKMIASFDNILHICVLVLEIPAQWFKALSLLILPC